MKKTFGIYTVGWLAVLALFNVVTFAIPGDGKYDNLFWFAYAFITLGFICQLACTYTVFQGKNLQKSFYNIPIFNISVTSLISMLIVGGLCMAVESIPNWVGIIACSAVLVFNIIAVAKATLAISVVDEIDTKIKTKTLFIKMLTADAQVLMQNNTDSELAIIVKKVYEEIRYSDPMSDDALASVESRISAGFAVFSDAVSNNNIEQTKAEADKLIRLINERNAKCKILK